MLYRGNDGEYYGGVDIWERFESNSWTPFAWDPERGTEWVETDDQELLELTPVVREEVPRSVEIERTDSGLSVA
ncbi:hypothetical protein [Halapricum salinum]|uniref:Uncharacterized protein n=1 Tax=Halapricum salinum TaxID=1457250 RepID=A0A4D6H935_9EURY|nr:hypothetical protein [Halapricum salinum]QCC50021.1 hypothetical protein DV733_01755 [Halapricum salinum]